MSTLFRKIKEDVKLLEPGIGPGSLTFAFVNECIKRNKTKKILSYSVDIDDQVDEFLNKTINNCLNISRANNVSFFHKHRKMDFVIEGSKDQSDKDYYTHVIMNPPYKKINIESEVNRELCKIGIKSANLYSAFICLSIEKLKKGGELVAIIPRSFCNGAYHKAFREYLIKNVSIQHIHIFNSRGNIFKGNSILQENIIIHCIKSKKQQKVRITSSSDADFFFDESSDKYVTKSMTCRDVEFLEVVYPGDVNSFIHISSECNDQILVDRISVFSSKSSDLGLNVSTGPVVDFRLKDYLCDNIEVGAVPLIYPIHLKYNIFWPVHLKKPNAIKVTASTISSLWQHTGSFVITRRFSTKEEKRRLVATYYDSSLTNELELIGFDNKLNVFHNNKQGFESLVAKGLFIYLNSSLLDSYYRLFGGHTQVNVTDLRSLPYPSIESLRRMGATLLSFDVEQKEIDALLEVELSIISSEMNKD